MACELWNAGTETHSNIETSSHDANVCRILRSNDSNTRWWSPTLSLDSNVSTPSPHITPTPNNLSSHLHQHVHAHSSQHVSPSRDDPQLISERTLSRVQSASACSKKAREAWSITTENNDFFSRIMPASKKAAKGVARENATRSRVGCPNVKESRWPQTL